MKLTIKITEQAGAWRASFAELPQIYYTAPTREKVRERIERLQYAMRSPHIRVEKILSNGEVILTLSRENEEAQELTESRPRTLSEAQELHAC